MAAARIGGGSVPRGEGVPGGGAIRHGKMRFLIANPTASLYNNRTQILAALEFACLDLVGQAWGVPVCDILGGRLRDRVPFAAYCFFRYPNPATGAGEVRTIDQVLENARALKQRFGFTSHKMKAGVFPQDYGVEAYRAGLGILRRFVPLRPQRRLEHGAGDPLRAGDRRAAQRLSGRSGVRFEWHAADTADGAGAAGHEYGGGELRATRGQRAHSRSAVKRSGAASRAPA